MLDISRRLDVAAQRAATVATTVTIEFRFRGAPATPNWWLVVRELGDSLLLYLADESDPLLPGGE